MDKMDIWNAVDANVATFMVLCHEDIEEQRQVLSVLNDAGFVLDRYTTSVLEGEYRDQYFNPLVSRTEWTDIDVAAAGDGYPADLNLTFEEFMELFSLGLKELEPIDETEFESELNKLISGV